MQICPYVVEKQYNLTSSRPSRIISPDTRKFKNTIHCKITIQFNQEFHPLT